MATQEIELEDLGKVYVYIVEEEGELSCMWHYSKEGLGFTESSQHEEREIGE